MNKDVKKVYRLPSGTYKVGAHGFVYRWSNFNREWVRSTATFEWLEEENRVEQAKMGN